MLVDDDPVVVVDLHPGDVQPHVLGARPAARGHEHDVGVDRRPVGEGGRDAAAGPTHVGDGGPEAHVPLLRRGRGEGRRDVAVEVAQQAVSTGGDDDLGTEGGEDVRHLHGDVAGPDDEHPRRQVRQPHHGVGGVQLDALALGGSRQLVGDHGVGPGGHDHLAGTDLLGPTVEQRHLELARPGETRPTAQQVHPFLVAAIGLTGRGDRVDPPEDAVAHVGEAHPLERRIDTEPPPSRTAVAISATWTYIFVGMQPTLRQVPPKTAPPSIIAKVRSDRSSVSRLLPDPLPMTAMSTSITRGPSWAGGGRRCRGRSRGRARDRWRDRWPRSR